MDARNYTTLTRNTLARRRASGFWQFAWLAIVYLLLSGHAYAELPARVLKSLAKYGIPPSSVSATVVALDSGELRLSHQAQKARNPASVMKLLTTFAALDILGPAHTWSTKYYIHGTLSGGVLDGDLVIKGNGDPYLVLEQFWLHLAALRERGVHTIKGNLLIDNSTFELPEYDPNAFDQQPTRLYNVGPSATLLNFNASRFRIHPVDGKVEVLLEPAVHNVVINNQLKLTDGRCRGAQNGWSVDVSQKNSKAYVVFTGQYTRKCGSYDLRRAVLNADAYLYGAFVHLWKGLGGNFEGGYANVQVKQEAEAFYTGESKTLAEVIAGTNKYSNNVLARQLLLAIGNHNFGDGSTVKDGVDSVRAWLDDNDLSMPQLVMKNGAGLSRQILVSADSMSSLLLHASNSPYQPEFLASFSLGGLDGTMKERLNGLDQGGRVRLKTGYVKGVRSLAGYLRADSGTDYAVVLFVSDSRVNFSNGNVIQDSFIRWVLNDG